MLLQKRGNIRKRNRMRFIRGLPEIFEYDECSVCECHSSAPFLRGMIKSLFDDSSLASPAQNRFFKRWKQQPLESQSNKKCI